MKYEIRLGREIINQSLHIIVGAVVAHTFLAYLNIWFIVLILLIAGTIREVWQSLRGKIQPLYIQVIDIATLILGGVLWYAAINIFNINVDLL